MQHKHIRRIIYPVRKLFRDKLKLLFISGVVALSIHNSFAQPVREQGYIVSPSALAMVKAGQVPVNLSAGLLDYSIPLFEINSDDFKWPVTLGYSYSGLKLEEAPGEVGLGWSIAGLGGVVTREVRGLRMNMSADILEQKAEVSMSKISSLPPIFPQLLFRISLPDYMMPSLINLLFQQGK